MLAFGATYWWGASHYDFVTPPEKFERRAAVLVEPVAPLPERQEVDIAESQNMTEETQQDQQAPEPELEESHPSDYIDQKGIGADGYIALAEKLIAGQQSDRSLVAWERVLDSAQPTQGQVKRAFEVLKLHKVATREEAKGIAIVITLHASVPGDLHAKMSKVLERSAALIEAGSGYGLQVNHEVSVLAVAKGKPRPAVSLWFSGRRESPRAHFLSKGSKELGLNEKVNGLLFNIVSPFLRQHTDLSPVIDLHNEVSAEDGLQFLLTRHCWRQFGMQLYQDQENGSP